MPTIEGRTWLEHLSPPECWRLLEQCPIGRLGVLIDSAPEVFPVNFVVDGESIVFRTDAGNKLRGLVRSPSVCFETDEIDLDRHVGWSVLVKGRAEEVHGADALRHAEALPLRFWALGDKPHFIRIVPVEVSGRRIRG